VVAKFHMAARGAHFVVLKVTKMITEALVALCDGLKIAKNNVTLSFYCLISTWSCMFTYCSLSSLLHDVEEA